MKPLLGVVALALLLSGCAGSGGGARQEVASGSANTAATSTSTGRYAMASDAYPDLPPDVSNVPDAVPRSEPRSAGGNRDRYEVWGKTYHVLADPTGYRKQGIASWYGEKFHGYTTASGEIYDMYKMSAAHKSLPLPTYARVTNTDNGRSVIVKVNDRGPFHDDREIDLSYAAAARLDILGRGTGRVRVEAIDPEAWQAQQGTARQATGQQSSGVRVASSSAPPRQQSVALAPATPDAAPAGSTERTDTTSSTPAPVSANGMFLQVAALGSMSNAQALQARLKDEISQPVRVNSEAGVHRVQVGPLAGPEQVEPVRDELRRAGYQQAFVVNAAP